MKSPLRRKELVVSPAPGFGTVAVMTQHRRSSPEIQLRKIKNGGKTLFWAEAIERDLDTGKVRIIRSSKETESQEKAVLLYRQWCAERVKKERDYWAAVAKAKAFKPPPPPGCDPWTDDDEKKLREAQRIALQNQYPRCFAHLKTPKFNDGCAFDMVANFGSALKEFLPEEFSVRDDSQFRGELRIAKRQHAGGKGKLIDRVCVLIAFNWKLGWCYLSNEQLAEKLGAILGIEFTEGQVKKYRGRTLLLKTKHPQGPPRKSA